MPNSSADRLAPARWAPACLALLTLIFCLRSISTYRILNDTADEAVHISCGLQVLETGRYTLEAQHPPLARILLAVPAYCGGLRSSARFVLWPAGDREFYWRTLSLARLGNLIWAPFLIGYVYLWGRRLYGPAAGLVAAALASFCPNVLAHASLATLDFGAATAIFISAYYFWRWSEQPGLRPCLLAALAFGVAVLTKLSALVLLPPLAAAFFLVAGSLVTGWPGWRTALGRGALFVAVAVLVVWAGYLFDFGAIPASQFPTAREPAVQEAFGRRGVPAPQFWRGVLDVSGHNAQGHPCYLLGELGQLGWWYYFPVALAVKTTLPLLLLVGLALVRSVRHGRAALLPLLAAAVVLAVCLPSHLNLGIRHVLVIYPFFTLAAASLMAGRRAWVALGVALAIWHAGESLAAHPDYLAYFNQSARGREAYFLLDSALDWGQDLERLRRFLEARRITEVYLSYFGRADPTVVGLAGVRPLARDARPTGWIAVSKAHLAGLGLPGYNLAWLKPYTPAARIGKSILVYYFPAR